jgi:hypothetical protein
VLSVLLLLEVDAAVVKRESASTLLEPNPEMVIVVVLSRRAFVCRRPVSCFGCIRRRERVTNSSAIFSTYAKNRCAEVFVADLARRRLRRRPR